MNYKVDIMVIIRGIVGSDNGGIEHIRGCGHNALVVTITLECRCRKQVGAIALYIVTEED